MGIKLWQAGLVLKETREKLTTNAVPLWNSPRLEIRRPFTCKQLQLGEKTLIPIQFDELLVTLWSNGDTAASTPRALEVVDGYSKSGLNSHNLILH